MFAIGTVISIYRKYEINYIHIFELDFRYKV